MANSLKTMLQSISADNLPAFRFRDRTLAKKAAALTAQLQGMASSGIKMAAGGDGQDTDASFEQAFGTLAFTTLQDRAPKLLDWLIGFQLVDRDSDHTKAVGVFGFNLHGQLLFAPVMFLSGKLVGYELLYVKSQDQFIPLSEAWVHYLLRKKPNVLGEGDSRSIQSLGIRGPDLRKLQVPPGRAKFGSAVTQLPSHWPDWLCDFAPSLGNLITTAPEVAEKCASLSLDKVFSENFTLCKLAYDTSRTYPAIGAAIEKFYGPDLFKTALLRHRDVLSLTDDILRKTAAVQRTKTDLLGHKRAAADNPPKMRIVEDSTITENIPQMTDARREKLLRDGYLIEDARDSKEVSVAYNTQVTVSLQTPDETGVYDVLVKPGKYEKCLVIMHPYSSRKRAGFCSVVNLDSGKWTNYLQSEVYVRPGGLADETWTDWYEDQKDAGGSLKTNSMYVVVTRRHEGTVPFMVEGNVGEGLYRCDFEDYGPESPLGRNGGYNGEAYQNDNRQLQLNQRAGTRLKVIDGTLYVPEDAKIILVKSDAKEWRDPAGPVPYSDKRDNRQVIQKGDVVGLHLQTVQKSASLKLGNHKDLERFVIENTEPLKIYSTGTTAVINDGPSLTTKSALFALVKGHGLREKQAKELLSEAASKRVVRARVKYAYGYGSDYNQTAGPGPSAPPFPETTYGSESYPNVSTIESQDEEHLVPGMAANNYDPQAYNSRPEYMPDPMTMQSAQQAAQTGQKEVFDTAMISGLLKNVRQDSLVDKYLPDLMKALNALGRLLFQFYWHNEEFSERYGASELSELEDGLKNSFEAIGDITLYLKQSSNTPEHAFHSGEADLAAANM